MGNSSPANKIWTANHHFHFFPGTDKKPPYTSVITFRAKKAPPLFTSFSFFTTRIDQMAYQRTKRITGHDSIASLNNQNQHQDYQQLEQEQNSPAQELAERVYTWSTTELDYRPDRGDIRLRSHPRISLYASTSKNEQPEYCPQAITRYQLHHIMLQITCNLFITRSLNSSHCISTLCSTSLCQGPCGPMFEYLADNLINRS